jgi:small ligand-binding sensory domain FIST
MKFGSGVVRVGNDAAASVPQADTLTEAAARAAATARAALGDVEPDLACVFVTGAESADIEEAGAAAVAGLSAKAVIGCSAPGVIGTGVGIEMQPSVSVWAGVLPGVRVQTFALDVLRTPDNLAVLGLPQPDADAAVGIVFADPRTFPIDGFVAASQDFLPGIPLVGGLATGPIAAMLPGRTWLCQDGEVFESGAVGALLSGDVGVRTVVSQGCRPIGPSMIVTKAEGNELIEIAGVPAVEKLQQILTELDPEDRRLALSGLSIGIAMDEYAEEHERGDFLIRGVAGLRPDRGSVVIGDLVEVGRTVRFQVRDAEGAHSDLVELLDKHKAQAGTPDGVLLFSCNGRGSAMFDGPDHDAHVVADALGTVAVGGFFAGGEIGPVGGRNHLHGFTASILTFGNGG